MFLVEVEGPLVQQGAGTMSLTTASEEAVTLIDIVPDVMGGLFRLHFQAAVTRQRIGSRSSVTPRVFRLTVGFVDLVGFTPYTASSNVDEVAELVESFERRSNDMVGHGAGVVKHIGDEVMFVEVDPVVAWRHRSAPGATASGEDVGVSPHAGVGFGPVIAPRRGLLRLGREPDVRASRLAVPGEILVTDELVRGASETEASVEFESAGRRMLKGFTEPIPLWSVTRSRPTP